MSIIINDLDKLLIGFCDLELDFFNLMCINKHYYGLIANNELFMQWNKCHLCVFDINNSISLFVVSCRLGLLLLSKYLVSKYTIDIHYNGDYVFQICCFNGHLDVAKWLVELTLRSEFKIINIHTSYDYAFRWSCCNGHYNIAKWLIELSKQPGFTPFSDNLITQYYNPQ